LIILPTSNNNVKKSVTHTHPFYGPLAVFGITRVSRNQNQSEFY